MYVKVDLLRHPHPYECSFSICNDCDYATRDAFETIHQFINSTGNTKLGKGLGLPIADSVFMYCQRPGVLSYFKGLSGNLSENSGFLKDAMLEGWIDSLHGYGDFVNAHAFSRELAERALDELERNNIKLKVWIDHGSADNSQNLNLPNIISRGDNPKHKAYHTDLLKVYGMAFLAGNNTDWIGQSGRRRYLSKSLPQSEVPHGFLKRVHGRFCGRSLLVTRKCADKTVFHFFFRARNGVLRPDASTLAYQLSDENVIKLIRSGGTMILLQHLGAKRKRSNESPYLDAEARRALNRIAEKYHDRIVWVAPTSQVLAYADLLERVELEATNGNGSLTVEIKARDKISSPLDPAELANLSFRIRNYHGNRISLKCGDYIFKRTEYESFEDKGTVIKLCPSKQK